MRRLTISVGKSRKDVSWKVKNVEWSDLLKKLSTEHRTHETASEYKSFSKDRQSEIKDVGGFVAGRLVGGRRKAHNIASRSCLTLDLDFADDSFWTTFTTLFDYEACLYSTHSHTADTPRYRLILPLDRDTTPDEYEATARWLAGQLDIEAFDDTTFQPERLMYYPSTPKDGDWVFEHQKGKWLSVDEVLTTYHDWTDRNEWAVSKRVGAVHQRSMKKQGDPTDKKGYVGAFCRTYGIAEAIEEFIPEAYVPTDLSNRYSYTGGSSAGGLVVYDNLYAYSHHSTDPCCGKTCNAFDLVRMHKFHELDDDAKTDTPPNRLPSYAAMLALCEGLPDVKRSVVAEQLRDDFSDAAEVDEGDDDEWLGRLETDNNGKVKSTINNVVLVLTNDPHFKGKLAFNEFEKREMALSDLIWREVLSGSSALTDVDDAQLRGYLERGYGISSKNAIQDGLAIVVHNHAFHPVKSYLNSLKWDGVSRVDTLLTDYLGATDNIYTRAVMRKVMCAAVSRIYNAGCKFDYMLTLVGAQGAGKSTFVKKLGLEWYSDSFGSMQGKEAFESIQGVWLMEMGELAAMNKSEVENTKHFISKQTDRYRVAYGRRAEEFPRQCVFIGTTNNTTFLRDQTGNRRFWVVDVGEQEPAKRVWDISRSEVDQLWAEAIVLYKAGEPLYLSREVEEEAKRVQEEHTEHDPLVDELTKYLNTPILPEDEWEEKDVFERRSLLNSERFSEECTTQRNQVSTWEIWTELMDGDLVRLDNRQAKRIAEAMAKVDGWQKGQFRVKWSKNAVRGYVRTSEILGDLM